MTIKKWKNHLNQWGLDSTYNHSIGVFGRLNTNGWSVGVMYQQPRGTSYERKKGQYAGQSAFYSLSFSEVKHEKQVKQQKENTSFPELGSSSPFVFGKLNNLYLLQLAYGREQVLLPSVIGGNTSVSFRYAGGLSLALLKPYYLNLMYVSYNPDQVITLKKEPYSEENKLLFLSRDRIFGGTKWSDGLGETSFVPGAFLEGSLVLQPSKNKFFTKTVAFGGQVAIHTKRLPIMAEYKPLPYVASLYIILSLGKQWK